MKRKMVWLMAGIMAVSLMTGCGNSNDSASDSAAESTEAKTESSSDAAEDSSSDDSAAEKTSAKGLSIGFSGDYLSDFMSYVVDGVTDAAKANGAEITVQDAEFDTAKQLQQVENFINAGMDAVVIKPVDSYACAPIKQACQEAGIPFVVVNQNSSDGCDVYVGSDHEYAGKLQAEYLIDQLPDGGNVAILMGDMTSEATTARTDGLKNALEEAGNFEIVSEQDAGWMRDEAMQKMENWLNSGLDIDAVVANSDEMAIGAAKVLAENNITDVLVCGIDASEDALNMMKEGKLSMTVFQNGYQQGYQGVEAALKLAAGEEVDEYVDVPYEAVLPDQADEYLEKIGK